MRFPVLYLLSLTCIGLSIYLINEHYSTAESSFCDVGKYFSCSKVNKSSWSVLFGVPIASFGAAWSFIFFVCTFLAHRYHGEFVSALFIWLLVGFTFIWYLILGEIVLESICLMCTAIHVMTVIGLGIAYSVYKDKRYKAWPVSDLTKLLLRLKVWIGLVLLLHALLFGYYQKYSVDYDHESLARCLTSKGVRLYGDKSQAQTRTQLAEFGESSKHIYFIDCAKSAGRCEEDGIDLSALPTWRFPSKPLVLDLVKPARAAELSGCSAH